MAHLDLSVPEGSVYGFLGPNGAGKSTTLKMILGLAHPTAGSIQVLGKKMDSANRLSILRQVGSLIESPSYYGHLTGEENLRIVQTLRGVPERNIREVLQIVRLDGQRGKKVAHYSLGMKQRLGLAAALLGYPKLLILDEPTNGLDPAGIQEMRELICELPGRFGMTVVVSSHLLSEIEQTTAPQIAAAYDNALRQYDHIVLLANSIGAYFAMLALQDRTLDKALFVSPVLDMERLILNMMGWAGVSEQALREKGEISTDFGETLSWTYLCYVREHPIAWQVPTEILYAGSDHLVSRQTVEQFAVEHSAGLTVLEGGEHWFHTEEQLAFLDGWIVKVLK